MLRSGVRAGVSGRGWGVFGCSARAACWFSLLTITYSFRERLPSAFSAHFAFFNVVQSSPSPSTGCTSIVSVHLSARPPGYAAAAAAVLLCSLHNRSCFFHNRCERLHDAVHGLQYQLSIELWVIIMHACSCCSFADGCSIFSVFNFFDLQIWISIL